MPAFDCPSVHVTAVLRQTDTNFTKTYLEMLYQKHTQDICPDILVVLHFDCISIIFFMGEEDKNAPAYRGEDTGIY